MTEWSEIIKEKGGIDMVGVSRAATILYVCLCLSACAEGNVRANYSLDKSAAQHHGLLVGSYGVAAYDSAYPVLATYYIVPAGVDANKMPNARHIEVWSGCDTLNEGDSDFDDVCSHLFVVDLPAGDYEIVDWSLDDKVGVIYHLESHFASSTTDPDFGQSKTVPVKFSIQAGKATYIGDLHMGVVTRDYHRGFIAAWPFVHDQSARDIPILKQQYPTLNDANIVMGVISFAAPPTDIKGIDFNAIDVPSPRPPKRLPKHKPY